MIVKYGEEISKGTVRADFISGANDLVKAEAFFPGWLNKLLTTCVHCLENYEEMLRHLDFDKEASHQGLRRGRTRRARRPGSEELQKLF